MHPCQKHNHIELWILEAFAIARVLIALGVPFVDTNPVPNPVRLIDLPLVAVGRDPNPAPWTSLSYAPLEAYLRGARSLGARVINFDMSNA